MNLRHIVIIITLFFPLTVIAQAPDATAIVSKVKEKYNQVKDFETDVNIKVNVEFLNVPESKAKLFFKQPNKTKLESTGFAMLPKQGIGIPVATLLSSPYTALYTGKETIKGKSLTMIKIIPISDTGDIILSTLWIDETRSVVEKITSSTRRGTVQLEFFYGKYLSFGLPETVKISFDLPNFSLPKTLTGDISSNSKDDVKKTPIFLKTANFCR
ncbi:MAG: hypothetical protein HYZ54_05095 [Ignavibacteriae bacterium]|nr:hypothetical protein [Ignavibacteriota bacterium]